MRPGGTRGIKRIIERTNPFADVFNPQRRNWLLAMVWEFYYYNGIQDRLAKQPKLELAIRVLGRRVYIYG